MSDQYQTIDYNFILEIPIITLKKIDLDQKNYQIFRDEISDIIKSHQSVIIDLSSLTYIDTLGLGVLIGILKNIKAKNGQLTLVIDNPQINKQFFITGLDYMFDILKTQEEAIASLQNSQQVTI